MIGREQPPLMIAIRGCDGIGFVMYSSIPLIPEDLLYCRFEIKMKLINS